MAEATDVQDAPVAPVADATAPDPIMDILTEDESESPKESSPEEAKAEEKPEVAEDTVAAPAVPEVPKKETEGETTVETEEQPQGKAEERKAQLNTEIRDLVSQRNALRDEVSKVNSEVYQPATEEELVGQGMSATDAKVEALNQKIEMRDYNDKVAEAQLTIESESERVITDFPIFNPQSTDFNKDVAESAAELLQDSLEFDPNTGQLIGSKVSPYKLYKTIAASHSVSTQAGQLKGQEDTEKMLSRADNLGGAAPKAAPKDPIMEILLDDKY